MTLARVLAVLVTAGATVPAAAGAEVPWDTPAPVAGVSSVTTLPGTQIGGRILVGASNVRSLSSPTVVARVQADGSTARRQTLAIAFARAAGYERAGVVVAGARPALSAAAAQRAPVRVALGSVRGLHGVGVPKALPGTAGQMVTSVGGNPASGIVAVVTASFYRAGAPTRTLWVRRGKVFRRALIVRPGTNARDTAVAVGPHGDVLFAWQGHRSVYARHLGPTGRAGATHRLGAGDQSSLQARIDDDGRLQVAWESQRVGEGSADSPAVVSYISARPGGGFGAPRVVGGSSLTGTGRYVMRPGLRLVAAGPRASLLAWTQYDGARFRVQVADVANGRVAVRQTVSPGDDDAVLGDLAWSASGGALVLWLTATRGHDGNGPQRVAAAVRAPGAPVFGAPELVSEAGVIAPFAPSAVVEARSGRGFAAWTALDQQARVAVRPASG